MARKLVAMTSVLVALGATGVAYGGKPRAQDAVTRAAAAALSARRPVAIVPGLQYDPGTMVPRGVGGPDSGSWET